MIEKLSETEFYYGGKTRKIQSSVLKQLQATLFSLNNYNEIISGNQIII